MRRNLCANTRLQKIRIFSRVRRNFFETVAFSYVEKGMRRLQQRRAGVQDALQSSPTESTFPTPALASVQRESHKKKIMKTNVNSFVAAGLVALYALLGGAAHAAAPYANATLQGALTPGVYGTVTLGNAPPPPVIYAQPVIIQRAPVYVQQPPLYLHVPPGHAKKWSRHCARYNACNRPVYFVKVRGDDDYERRHGVQPQAVYMNKNDWKEARKYEKEQEKQAKKHWKKHDKDHGQRDHDD